MNKRYYEHTLPIIRGSLSNTYFIHVITILYLSDYVPAEQQHPLVRLNARIIRVPMFQIIQHLRHHFGWCGLYLPPHLRRKPPGIVLVP